MKGHQSVLFLTTSIILFLSVDAEFLRDLAEQLDKEKSDELEVSDPILSHKFSDYETNGDGFIDYEELAFHFMKKFKIENLEDMREPFTAADKDGDGKLDREEFAEFPLHDSETGVGKERRGCKFRCGIKCRGWRCKWYCYLRC